MSRLSSKIVIGSLVAVVAGLAIGVLPPGAVRSARSAPPASKTVVPLALLPVSVPFKVLPAAPAGGFPSNVLYTVTSSAPFCIQGLRMDPNTSVAVGPGDAGDLTIAFSRIDGAGLSHDSIRLVEGASGGFRPLDIALTYGGPLCAVGSIELHATQWQASHGAGVPLQLDGTAIILAPADAVITIN